jgi:hypothetical protein
MSASISIALRTVLGHVASSVKSAVRAHTSHASRWPASDALDCFRFVLPLQNLSLRTGIEEGSRGALTHAVFGFSVNPSAVQCRRHPARLTSRSSRPRVVASAKCFTLRLHVSAAPPQGGLTQALGGKKHSAVSFAFRSALRLRLACSSESSRARCLFGCCTDRAQLSHALRLPASATAIVIGLFSRD